MFVYSNKILLFINKIKNGIHEILTKEIKVRVSRNRFYDFSDRYSYPISVQIYNDRNYLGYFDGNFYELGFHECLMQVSEKQLYNIIRHELAHYFLFIEHENAQEQPHSPRFRAFCMRRGWGEEVYSATISLETGDTFPEIEKSSVFRKVQKLMALAGSRNENEAEQAMIKSQQLLLKHNIDSAFISNEEDEKIFTKRIMKQKKENAKMRAISRILETYFVNVIYQKSKEAIYIEILGNAVNIEIAEYVAEVLSVEFEKLWDHVREHYQLKGITAKNSFFLGLARGYCDKIGALKREYVQETVNALMIIEKKLQVAKNAIYPHLTSIKSKGSFCSQSSALGEQMGRELQINPAVKSSAQSNVLIGYKGA